MNPRLTAAVVVVALVLLGLGWWLLRPTEPEFAIPRPDAPEKVQRAAEPRPAEAPPAPPHPDAKPKLVFERKPEHTPEAAGVPADPSREPATSMDDLPDDEREAFIQSGLDALNSVLGSCKPFLDRPVNAVARATLDGRGLLQLELSTYEEDEEHLAHPSEAVIPMKFASCLEDALWDQEWYDLPEGDVISFELTMPLLPEE